MDAILYFKEGKMKEKLKKKTKKQNKNKSLDTIESVDTTNGEGRNKNENV